MRRRRYFIEIDNVFYYLGVYKTFVDALQNAYRAKQYKFKLSCTGLYR